MTADAGEDGGRPPAIDFANGNTARVAWAGRRKAAPALLAELGLPDQHPVLLVAGGARSMSASIAPELSRLLERGAIRAAADTGAVVMDGGTDSGVMGLLGRAAATSDASVVLLGVAPGELVTFRSDVRPGADARTGLEPNHTHFLLANTAEWGGETSLLFDAVDTLAKDRPAAVLLAGGGEGSLEEAAAASERGLPIVVLSGSGGVADLLAGRPGAAAVAGVDGKDVAAIAAATSVTVVDLEDDPTHLARVLTRLLQVDETLRDAWRKQMLVSAAASREQGSFRREQNLVLILGVILTFLVVANTVLGAAGLLPGGSVARIAFYFAILIIPIGVGTVVAAAGRMRPGSRWIVLRGTSETLKREIYRYRTRASIYSHEHTLQTSRETKLALAVGSAMDALMRTDVSQVALDPDADRKAQRRKKTPQVAAVEDAIPQEKLTHLTPDGYVEQRIGGQVDWYLQNAARLSRNSRMLKWLALLFGALGTFFAAIQLQIWVAVTSAVVAAYATYSATWQLDTSLALYNQAASSLDAVRLWWYALSPAEQARQANIDKLVDSAEQVMKAEQSGWVQEMQDAMKQLRLEPEDTAQGQGGGAGPAPGDGAGGAGGGAEAAPGGGAGEGGAGGGDQPADPPK